MDPLLTRESHRSPYHPIGEGPAGEPCEQRLAIFDYETGRSAQRPDRFQVGQAKNSTATTPATTGERNNTTVQKKGKGKTKQSKTKTNKKKKEKKRRRRKKKKKKQKKK